MKFAVLTVLLLAAAGCGHPAPQMPTCDASNEGDLIPRPGAKEPYAQSDMLMCTKLPNGVFAWAAPLHVVPK